LPVRRRLGLVQPVRGGRREADERAPAVGRVRRPGRMTLSLETLHERGRAARGQVEEMAQSGRRQLTLLGEMHEREHLDVVQPERARQRRAMAGDGDIAPVEEVAYRR